MKLLRAQQSALTGKFGVAAWDTFLNDGIPVGPFAKIGLLSITLPMAHSLSVDATNDTFTIWTTNTSAATVVTLTRGLYTPEELTDHLNQRIVQAYDFTDARQLGIRCVFSFSGSPLSAAFRYTRVQDTAFAAPAANGNSNNVTLAAGILRPTADPTGLPAGMTFICDPSALLRGAAFVRTQHQVLGETRLGLVGNFQTDGPVADADLDYMVMPTDDGTGTFTALYMDYTLSPRAPVDSGFVLANNDWMEIEVRSGVVVYTVWRGAPGAEALVWRWPAAPAMAAAPLFPLGKPFRPALVFYGNAARATLPVLTKDPDFGADPAGNFVERLGWAERNEFGERILGRARDLGRISGTLAGSSSDDLADDLADAVESVPPTPTSTTSFTLLDCPRFGAWRPRAPPLGLLPDPPGANNTLTLTLVDGLRKLLGFDELTWTSRQGATDVLYADTPVDAVLQGSGLVVVCPTLPQLQSWDGATSARRPILAAVAGQWTFTNFVLQYSPHTVTMLELNNPVPLHLKHITLQCYLQGSGGGVGDLAEVSAPCSAVLLIDDGGGPAPSHPRLS